MSNLPVLSGRECVSALVKAGFYIKRQKGSHIIVRKDFPFYQIVVPNHKSLDRGTLFNIIKCSGMSIDKFKEFC